MTMLYGIKNCNSVKKACDFLNYIDVEFAFFDFKKEKCSKEKIEEWINIIGIDVLLNKRSTTYKNLNLKNLDLTIDELINKISEHNLLMKRPILEYKNKIIIGFDEDKYNLIFLKG
jgi:Spx/MgsR family transcriptional regulator